MKLTVLVALLFFWIELLDAGVPIYNNIRKGESLPQDG